MKKKSILFLYKRDSLITQTFVNTNSISQYSLLVLHPVAEDTIESVIFNNPQKEVACCTDYDNNKVLLLQTHIKRLILVNRDK